jgi:BirA family transcriptional regulator, biotin operon repressor / biotin---[acetyl-CoA-carboxylase] ligase
LIRTVPETASTNADMLALAVSGALEGAWLRAEWQTAGRGRMGRDWSSPVGNLYASTLVRLMPTDPSAATLGFVAAVALHEVLGVYAPEATLQIKWPNDVLADGAKISGILLERTGDAVVIGIGVNLASHPEIEGRRTTNVAALSGAAPDPHDFLETLADGIARWLARWRGEGVGIVVNRWQNLAHPIGTALSIVLPDGEKLEGLYQGLDREGALKLRLAHGTVRAIHAGDVFLV